uniref:CCHC-type domain-containing protein n=1 Tax=Chelonoidis abingdonii TaxID=106734 RepID=A0A8C0QPG0_CHEAB
MGFYSGTPLGCMLDNWMAFRSQADYGTVLCKDDLIKFCKIEWPTFGVEWPNGGTLKLEIVQAVHGIVTRDGHWDQNPYIDIWQDLVANSPPWLQKCRQKTFRMLMAHVPIEKPSAPVKKPCQPPVIPQTPDYVIPPPLYPSPSASVYPSLRDLDRREGTDRPPPIKAKEASPEQTSIPVPTEDGDGVYQFTRSRTGGERTVIYVPFATSDLYNWKQQNPPFSEDPASLMAIFEMLITAHNPTWGDVQVALNVLLTADERRMVLAKAREWVTQTYAHATVTEVLPEKDPHWSHNEVGVKEHQRYATAIVQDMKRCIRKTPNWAKLYNIRQEKKENPAAFYECLCDTCRKYTVLDPGDQNGKRVLIPLFIGQSYDDIRKKLQKVEGVSGKNIEELLEIALKVYDRRDEEERKKGARALAMALRKGNEKIEQQNIASEYVYTGDRGKCAICRQEGHWKNECPNRNTIRQGRVWFPLLTLYR